MYVKVLFDNKAKRGLLSGWGFSCIIDNRVLFDTGEAPVPLAENMQRLMVPMAKLEAVVISHDHWDHTGGLWDILKKKKGLKVYACPSFESTFKSCVKELKGKLVFNDKPKKITENIYVTGEVRDESEESPIAEQALIVKGEKGISIITGCAHPGIVKIVEHVKKQMGVDEIYMVFGGFHLQDEDRESITKIIKDLKKLGVAKIGPTHCTGEKAIRMFKGQYHEDFIPVRAGYIIQL